MKPVIPCFYEFFRYIAGCALGLSLKLLLTALFDFFEWKVWVGYLLTHIVLLFSGFLFHHRITFQRKFGNFCSTFLIFLHYIAAVIFFKTLDYILVVISIAELERHFFGIQTPNWQQRCFHLAVIAASSGILFLVRYFCFRFLFHKKKYEYYIGEKLKDVYLTHAAEPEIAVNAASGGLVTALLAGMLRRKEIDGAVVSSMTFDGSKIPAISAKIIRKEEELYQVQGSIYSDFTFFSSVLLDELKNFSGRLAIVGIPCQLKALEGVCSANPDIGGKIVLKIGLFCGHTSKPELLEGVWEKKQLSASEISAFRFRKGPWRGYAEAVLRSGERRIWPTAFYNLYQNLFIAAPRRCMCCFDHFAENADISTGDVWCQKYRFESIKPSMTAVRTDVGERYFRSALAHGDLTAESQTAKELFAANSRSAVFHKAIAARSKVLEKYGITIPVPPQAAPARWNEILAARIIARFFLMPPEKALRINRRILKAWLYLMKGFTSF